jgi:hypothetical protein
MLKAIAPTDAKINIVKFNTSAMASIFVCFLCFLERAALPLPSSPHTSRSAWKLLYLIVAENPPPRSGFY